MHAKILFCNWLKIQGVLFKTKLIKTSLHPVCLFKNKTDTIRWIDSKMKYLSGVYRKIAETVN